MDMHLGSRHNQCTRDQRHISTPLRFGFGSHKCAPEFKKITLLNTCLKRLAYHYFGQGREILLNGSSRSLCNFTNTYRGPHSLCIFVCRDSSHSLFLKGICNAVEMHLEPRHNQCTRDYRYISTSLRFGFESYKCAPGFKKVILFKVRA